MERPLPEWVPPEVVERTGIREFEQSQLPAPGWGVVNREARWMLTAPFVGSAMSRIAERALTAGVELRSPLLDTRLIALALTRPHHERVRRGDSKWLLRAAMRDLLPPVVLASRPQRTGTTVGYSRYWMRERMPAALKRMCAQPLELEALGLVDGAALRRARERYESGWVDDHTRLHLYHTMEVELWLRARRSPESAAAISAPAVSRDRREAGANRRSHIPHSTQFGGSHVREAHT
jgi:asparagine synthase (glutamine-hydrolysing)